MQWTPNGDAFIIGSDLNRLESETLPQYFRHNRFQSLVRQLNFYSFRKINRERNVWIYKHSLFHRDRPEDLNMVRRRTCPGMDGRKQRFSRFSVGSLGQADGDDNSDNEDSSLEATVDAYSSPVIPSKKRDLISADKTLKPPSSKRFRQSSNADKETKTESKVVVDTSMLEEVINETQPLVGDKGSFSLLTNRAPVNVNINVADVASKLEKCARKAMKERGLARSLRSGVVTPPYGASNGFQNSSTALLTYDDEYETNGGILFEVDARTSPATIGTIPVDGDESVFSDYERSSRFRKPHTVSPLKRGPKGRPPVSDASAVESILNRIMKNQTGQTPSPFITPVAVAGFCMSTSPLGDRQLCSKILQLIASCSALASDFQLYRAALHPTNPKEVPSYMFSPSPRESRAITVQQIWQREVSRGDAVRDFKTFAVNCMHQLLGKGNVEALWSREETDMLEHAAGVWLKSAGVTI
jgi:hypothetical protein